MVLNKLIPNSLVTGSGEKKRTTQQKTSTTVLLQAKISAHLIAFVGKEEAVHARLLEVGTAEAVLVSCAVDGWVEQRVLLPHTVV